MDTTAQKSGGFPWFRVLARGVFGFVPVALLSGCISWSPDSLDVSLAPAESKIVQVEFTSAVSTTHVTTFVVPGISDHVSLSPSSFATIRAGETYSIDVTLTSPPGMDVAQKDGVIMLRQGRRTLARPLPVNLSFGPKTYPVTVTATATAGGEISPASQIVAQGDVAVFRLQRNPDFGISRVTGCAGARIGDTYTTAPIVESCAVEAVFGELVYFGTNPINDTGIDWCADLANNYDLGDAGDKTRQCEAVINAGFPAQDGHFGRDALARAGELPKIGDGAAGFDYTKISNSGDELPATAKLGSGPDDWACTRDNLTGLIWEVKVHDSSHLRDQHHTYTWYDPNSTCDTTGFMQAVNDQALCGASDWRMPTWQELQGIVDYGRHNPTIDTRYFPNTPGNWFWSGSPHTLSFNAWVVGFSGGTAYLNLRGSSRSARLVRGGD